MMNRRTLMVGASASIAGVFQESVMGQNTGAAMTAGLLPVAVKTFGGPNGKVVSDNLRAALAESNFFAVVNRPNGVPVAQGNVGEKFIEARLVAPNGKEILRERLASGNARLDARRFADQVTLALAKRRGIASSQIAFVASRGSQNSPEICLCDGDGKNLRQLTKDGRRNLTPSISKNGSQILYTSLANGTADLYLYDLVDGNRVKINQNPAAHIVGALSPDGKNVVMAAGPTAQISDLFIAPAKGGKSRRLTSTPNPEMMPSWSPDGRTIVFAAMTAPNQSALFTVTNDRNAVAKPLITGLPNCGHPCWSPDGKRIAFSSTDASGRAMVCVLSLGGRARRLVPGNEPSWGADSRHLVHTISHGLSITDTDTGRTRQIVGGMGRVMNPSWTR